MHENSIYALTIWGVVMNNTFNYSFLINKETEEISQHQSFISSEIISEKYVSKQFSETLEPNSNKLEVSGAKNQKFI